MADLVILLFSLVSGLITLALILVFLIMANNVASMRKESNEAAEKQLRVSQTILDETVKSNALARQQLRAYNQEPEA